jgi:lipoprotein-anchoring transpeptidase ErfK/SrfK
MLVIHEIAMRTIAALFLSVTLGGCAYESHAPIAQGEWAPRKEPLMSNVQYRPVVIPGIYRRQLVDYQRKELPGTVVIDTNNKFLYYVLPNSRAIRYGIAVGKKARAWSGVVTIGRKEKGPPWIPTSGERSRLGLISTHVPGGASIR